jgi:hypothetical protein
MLSINMLNAITSVIMVNVIIHNAIMLSVVKLSIIMLNDIISIAMQNIIKSLS